MRKRWLLGGVALACAATACADDTGAWNRFRGPNGAGVARVAALPDTLAKTQILWKSPLPPGVSSPILLRDGAILVTGLENGRIVLACLDPTTGKRRWTRPAPEAELAKEGVHEESSAAASTPATDGTRIVVFVPGYGLWAVDARGRALWRRPLKQDPAPYGKGSSPILAQGRVFQLVEARDPAKPYLAAVDLRSGKLLWRTERPRPSEGATWSTPVLWDGQVVVLGSELEAFDPRTGRRLWTIPGFAEQPVPTPAVAGDTLFLDAPGIGGFAERGRAPTWEEMVPRHDTDGDGSLTSAEMVDEIQIVFRRELDSKRPWNVLPLRVFFGSIDADKDGRIARAEWDAWITGGAKSRVAAFRRAPRGAGVPTALWESPRGVGELPSPLAVGGRLFTVRDGGRLACFDADTGTLRFDERLPGAGGQYVASPVALVAGDAARIVLASARGVVTVATAADTLSVLSTLDLGAPIKATPAIDGPRRRLYLRAGDTLHAFALAR